MDCQQALQHIKTAITKHLEAQEKYKTDLKTAQKAHTESEKALRELRSFEIEAKLKLKEQYDEQVKVLIECGFLTDLNNPGSVVTIETLEKVKPGFIGIDNRPYYLPPY